MLIVTTALAELLYWLLHNLKLDMSTIRAKQLSPGLPSNLNKSTSIIQDYNREQYINPYMYVYEVMVVMATQHKTTPSVAGIPLSI